MEFSDKDKANLKEIFYKVPTSPEQQAEEAKQFEEMFKIEEMLKTAAPMPFTPVAPMEKLLGEATVLKELLERVQPLNEKAYMVTIPKDITAQRRAEYMHGIHRAWENLNDQLGTHKLLLMVPEDFKPIGLADVNFDFSIAIKLLKQGYKVQRDRWDGYLYMRDGILYHSNDGNREYIPTQKAVLAVNWRIAA